MPGAYHPHRLRKRCRIPPGAARLGQASRASTASRRDTSGGCALALTPKWVRREVALLWRYVDGLWKDRQSILGSLGVIAVAAAARLAMEPLIPYLRVHYPAIVPWLSGRPLVWMG